MKSQNKYVHPIGTFHEKMVTSATKCITQHFALYTKYHMCNKKLHEYISYEIRSRLDYIKLQFLFHFLASSEK